MIARQVLHIPVYSGPERYESGMMLGNEQRLDLQQHQIHVLQLFDSAHNIGAVKAYLFDRPSNAAPDHEPNRWSDEAMTHLLGALYMPTPADGFSQIASQTGWPLLPIEPCEYVWCSLITLYDHSSFEPGAELQLAWTGSDASL